MKLIQQCLSHFGNIKIHLILTLIFLIMFWAIPIQIGFTQEDDDLGSLFGDTKETKEEEGDDLDSLFGDTKDTKKEENDDLDSLLSAKSKPGSKDRYTVKVIQDEKGWKIKIDDEDFFMKGMVWGYSPIGWNYVYNQWAESDEFIKKIIDYNMEYLKAMGVNTIRYFSDIPPKWVTYIYRKYGIYSIINDMCGRYGLTINGVWVFPTDYSDPETRREITRQALGNIKKYKDVPGVLFYLLGNENNYGLVWKTAETQDLPQELRHKAAAKYLYSLFESIMKKAKRIAPHRPIGIVNGEVQYLEIIKKMCPSIDFLALNVYRGAGHSTLFEVMKNGLNKPFMLSEFGCDAYNVRTGEEDQYHQAFYTKIQWKELYLNSYGKGYANTLGGCHFHFIDGWWMTGQNWDLMVHNTGGNWKHEYYYDYVEGMNNMNEEWWGICAYRPDKIDGVQRLAPRAAYYTLQYIWKINPLENDIASIEKHFEEKVDLNIAVARGKANYTDPTLKKFRLAGGKIHFEITGKMKVATNESPVSNWKKKMNTTDGEMAFINFAFHPTADLYGGISLNILGNVPERIEDSYYERRGLPYTLIDATNASIKRDIKDTERIEIYNFSFAYDSPDIKIDGFYHTGHYHWRFEGDFFGLIQEATDIPKYDIYNAKAPVGFEITCKKWLDGLKILAGPEIYWGANPKIVAKYYKGFGFLDLAVMHSEDIGKNTDTTYTSGNIPATRKTTLYLKTGFIPITTIEIGGLMASLEKVARPFRSILKSEQGTNQGYINSGYDVTQDYVELKDTFAVKTKISSQISRMVRLDGQFHYAGLVAEGGPIPGENGSLIWDDGAGNKIEYKGGFSFVFGSIQINPSVLYRKPLVGPNFVGTNNAIYKGRVDNNGDIYPRIGPRNTLIDPFAVLGNREAMVYEFIFTYEPTGASWFYDWKNDEFEDAPIAFNLVFNYASYPTYTDAYNYVMATGETASFEQGLPPADVWTASSKIVLNLARKIKFVSRISTGEGQSAGDQMGRGVTNTKFYTLELNSKIYRFMLLSHVKKDMWGPLDWYKQFNITYPWQVMVDISYHFGETSFLADRQPSHLGVQYLRRDLDKHSYEYDGETDYIFQVSVYYDIIF